MARTIFPYYGGKFYMADRIIAELPRHQTYIEVFGGAGSVMFRKPPSNVDVLNDIDMELANFYKVLRHPIKSEELLRLLSLSLYSRVECEESGETNINLSDVESARRYFVRASMVFSGGQTGWSFSKNTSSRNMAGHVSAWLSRVEHLPEFHEKLSRIQIECKSWEDILCIYNSRDTLAYLDPPYVLDTRAQGYKHELSNDDHKDLVDVLLDYPGMVLLSGYEHEIYLPLEHNGWSKIQWKQTSCAAKGPNTTKTETLWINPLAQKNKGV